MIKYHYCPNCEERTEVDFENNRRVCKKCGWYGDKIKGGQTSS